MNRLLLSGVFAGLMIIIAGCRRQPGSSVTQPEKKPQDTVYYQANHGFDGGLNEMVDLSKRAGFDDVQTIDDVARFAASVPGAIGFTAHPNFEDGTRYASAIKWYTKLSPIEGSWTLYLFDKSEAQKEAGDSPRDAALTAAEAKIFSKLNEAKELIAAGGTNGVKMSGKSDEHKFLALAVLRLGGAFQHRGTFELGHCGACRIIFSSGNPLLCRLGIQKKEHWNCCGSTDEGGHCEYWKRIKDLDDSQ